MRPSYWKPRIELSTSEQSVIRRIRRARLFVFLRMYRHEILNESLQCELTYLYRESQRGHPPVPPALLAMATLMQAYTGVSDDEVIEASTMDRRWQLVLDCLDVVEPPFSKGTLIAFRRRLIDADMHLPLVERVIEVAKETGAFGSGPLRAMLDSSPLWVAGIGLDFGQPTRHWLNGAALEADTAQLNVGRIT